MDPATGHREVEPAEFDRGFTGVVLELAPGPGFVRGGRPGGVAPALAARLRGSWRVLAAAVVAGVLLTVPGIVVPAMSAMYIDRVLLEGAHRWVLPMVLVAAVTLGFVVVLAGLQQRILARLEQRLAITGGAGFVQHVLRLPVDFFAHRYAGDVASRVSGVEAVCETLAARLAPAVVGSLTALVFLVAMVAIDWKLSAVAVLCVALVAVLAVRSGHALADRARTAEQDTGLSSGALAAGLSAIETVKGAGRESDLFARLAGAHARVARSRQELARLATGADSVPGFVESLLVHAVVLSAGGWQVMRGDLTLGSLLAFQALLIGFLGPVVDLAGLSQRIQELRATLARIDDVARHPADPLAIPSDAVEAPPEATPGRLEFRDVTFGYSHGNPPLVEGFSLAIEPGRRVALVGMTGSGKSTIARLALGLHLPWSGDVLLDGRPLRQVPRHERISNIAMVGQSPTLLEGSLRDNLSMWDPFVPDEWMREALADAGLGALLADRGGLEARIAEGGTNFSGGEAQRVEIARALARRPSVLVLDEATSALDATTEAQIDRAIRRRGCTCLVVAHRLSTIRDADEIVVLGPGGVLERGSHDELMELDAHYALLMRGGER
jgi:ABC-type bacteriocin/lantibiotic exporter with double-glycine peptidase domain